MTDFSTKSSFDCTYVASRNVKFFLNLVTFVQNFFHGWQQLTLFGDDYYCVVCDVKENEG